MTQNTSAGLLMCRKHNHALQFFLVHPGGPYFRNKDLGAWSIPKGLPEHGGEDILSTAQREFIEETGIHPTPPFHSVGTVRQKSGKVVHAWAFLGDWDPTTGIQCNTFKLEWPPQSGRYQEFPEQDKAAWWNFDDACSHIIAEQAPFIQRAKELFRITA